MKNDSYPKIISLKTVDSTNNYAYELAGKGAREFTVVKADTQTKGKGRFERGWISPLGGIYASLILRPRNCKDKVLLLPLTFSKAITLALKKYVDATVRMPNDIMVKGKKIAGVLAESGTDSKGKDFLIAGAGININTKKELLPGCATSLYIETGKLYNIREVFKELLREILNSYNQYCGGSSII
ncbi:MAG: biotin--[acetyl-CoA-carboxylase] ligase [Candidatus Omnitrophota bacterium]